MGSARMRRPERGYLKMRCMRSYTARPLKIQPRHLTPLAGVLVFALGVSGCSRISMPVGANDVATPTILTGSIPSPLDEAYSDISSYDRQIIASQLDSLDRDLAEGSDLQSLSIPWQNGSSGNSGTLSAVDTATYSQTGCLSFRTTANTIAGVKLYAGTACRDITRKFAVTELTVSGA